MAVARMAMACVLLSDLLIRLSFCREFYSDDGFCSRLVLLRAQTSYLLPSLHLANDLETYQSLLLIIQLCLAGALLLGYRTRTVSALSWLLLLSLHQRNPLLLNSGDTLMAALLFWGIFLPWGAVWSVDSKARSGEGHLDETVLSAATIGWSLQMACLYLFAALHKLHPYWLSEGSAIYYALNIGHHSTAWAVPLTDHPEALAVLTRVVWLMELCLGLAILLPTPRPRILAISTAAILHLTFGLFLEIGVFRYVPLVGLLALVPGRFFGADGRSQPRIHLGGPLAMALLSVCLLTCAVNLESLGKGRKVFLPDLVLRIAPVFSSLQYFGVFAGPGLEEDGWFTVQVQAQDGRDYDAWRGDRAWSAERPPLVSATYPDDRWRKYMMNLPTLPVDSPFRQGFAEWAARQWNRRHPENRAVLVRVWQARVETRLPGPSSSAEWSLIAEAKL